MFKKMWKKWIAVAPDGVAIAIRMTVEDGEVEVGGYSRDQQVMEYLIEILGGAVVDKWMVQRNKIRFAIKESNPERGIEILGEGRWAVREVQSHGRLWS